MEVKHHWMHDTFEAPDGWHIGFDPASPPTVPFIVYRMTDPPADVHLDNVRLKAELVAALEARDEATARHAEAISYVNGQRDTLRAERDLYIIRALRYKRQRDDAEMARDFAIEDRDDAAAAARDTASMLSAMTAERDDLKAGAALAKRLKAELSGSDQVARESIMRADKAEMVSGIFERELRAMGWNYATGAPRPDGQFLDPEKRARLAIAEAGLEPGGNGAPVQS